MQNKSTQKGKELKEYVLLNNEEISPDVFLLSVKRDFEFMPGQVVQVAMDLIHPPRIYSICSGNQGSELQILFNIKEDGYLTPKLAGMIPGDRIYMSNPYGSFADSQDPSWWIATGTGIAPFYSMLKSGLEKNKTLIHGVRNLNQFYFEDEFEWKLGKSYIRCCSKENSCDTFPGRVTDYVKSLDNLPDVRYFVCGKPIMVVEMRDLLIERGIPYENILAEIYF